MKLLKIEGKTRIITDKIRPSVNDKVLYRRRVYLMISKFESGCCLERLNNKVKEVIYLHFKQKDELDKLRLVLN